MIRALSAGVCALVLAACGGESPPQTVTLHDDNPVNLSDWGLVTAANGALELGDGVTPYDLNTPLFTDYAHKLRTVWMPEGASAQYREGDVLDFPVGTVITKTFYYPRGTVPGRVAKAPETASERAGNGLKLDQVRLIETRLLIRDEGGWRALPYVWNAEQSEATLQRGGAVKRLTLEDEGQPRDFAYIVPDANQCKGCHATNNTTREIRPIGPKPRNLNKTYAYAEGAQYQIAKLVEAGYLVGAPAAETAPALAVWDDESAPVTARARAYLDVNCAHCHNPAGPADTSGLHLNVEAEEGAHLGVCKPPIAAGRGSGGHTYGVTPGAPDESILLFRMRSDAPDIMMPELGRSLVHEEGAALVEAWIAGMDGACRS